jgi:hypothetical protein
MYAMASYDIDRFRRFPVSDSFVKMQAPKTAAKGNTTKLSIRKT